MCDIYKIFGNDFAHCLDFSDEMMLNLYYQESYGDIIKDKNGFYYGKKYLNLQVNMWKEDIQKGLLFKHELYDDGKFPHWWLDRIFK